MANPNIVNVTSIYGNTTYLTPSSGSTATVWTALTPAVGTVNKVNNIVASNVTASAVAVTVSINSAVSGGGTAYDIAYQISVPANASLIIIDKTTSIYVGEAQSIVVTVGTGSAIELTSSYEAITS
jgi:hypothetical protein